MKNYRSAILLVLSLLLIGCASVQPNITRTRILFIGNSITHHGPSPDLGWSGDWGMAASAADKDYVHLLANGLNADFQMVTPAWETNYNNFDYSTLDQYLNWADIVVIEFGENVPVNSPNFPGDLATAMAKLVRYTGQNKPTYVISSWWPYSPIDDAMKAGAEQAGAKFVLLPPYDQSTCFATTFSNPGVAIHPNDNGMLVIAKAVVAAMVN